MPEREITTEELRVWIKDMELRLLSEAKEFFAERVAKLPSQQTIQVEGVVPKGGFGGIG